MQTYIYYKKNYKDPPYFKLLVRIIIFQRLRIDDGEQILFLWYVSTCCPPPLTWHDFCRILDSVHLALITHASYYYMISNFGNIVAIVSPTSYVWTFKQKRIRLTSPLWIQELCMWVFTVTICSLQQIHVQCHKAQVYVTVCFILWMICHCRWFIFILCARLLAISLSERKFPLPLRRQVSIHPDQSSAYLGGKSGCVCQCYNLRIHVLPFL